MTINKTTFRLANWLLLPLGVIFLIIGEFDDSPGLMLLGLINLIIFFHRRWRWKNRNDKEKSK